MSGELFLFFSLAFIAVATAVGMLFSRYTVYSALHLVTNFITVAVFYLLLDAPFISLAQVTVYAGAIMVLFLFVIMLLGAEKTGARLMLSWQTPLAIGLAVVVVLLGAWLLMNTAPIEVADLPAAEIMQGTAEEIGLALYSVWLFPFEAVSILLLVAMIGAVVMTRQEARDERKKKSA